MFFIMMQLHIIIFLQALGGNVESSPAIGDIDGDGDFEIVFGTTQWFKGH